MLEEHRRERELLEHHPDVERVLDRTDLHTILEVWFEDELFRTDEPALLDIREKRRRPKAKAPPATTDPRFNGVIDAEFEEVQPPGVPLSDDQRRALIERAIGTVEGRRTLAQTMMGPIRRNLDYQSIARRTFLVEQLPQGALPTYDRDPQVAPMIMDQGHTGAATGSSRAIQNLYETMIGYDPAGAHLPDGTPLGAPETSGSTAIIAQVQGGTAQISGLAGMRATDIGRYLEISGSAQPGNNGLFQIVRVDYAAVAWISNPNAVQDFIALRWALYHPPPFERNADYRFFEASFVTDPPDPRARLQQMVHPGEKVLVLDSLGKIEIPKEPEKTTGWERVLKDEFLEND